MVLKPNETVSFPACPYEFYNGRLCGEELSPFKRQNKLYEYIYFNSQFLCPFSEIGCDAKPLGSGIEKHKKQCHYRYVTLNNMN
jgi:hypothetical protein